MFFNYSDILDETGPRNLTTFGVPDGKKTTGSGFESPARVGETLEVP